jgi:cell shape-determining protein MreC
MKELTMKITDPNIVATRQNSNAKKMQKTTGQSFNQTLEECMSSSSTRKSTASESSNVASIPRMTVPTAVNAVDSVFLMPQEGAMKQAEDALNLLQTYQQDLLDPAKSVKDLASTVQSMDREADSLNSLLEDFQNEPEIQSLMEKLAVVMKVEVMKYNRGDYV